MRLRKGALIAAAVAVSIALYFWTQSRIPQLGEKAMMGGRANVALISFGELYPVDARMPLLKRIALTSVNWGNTNWKGMTFGLLFAAAMLTLLSFLPRRAGGRNVWLNTLKGVALGTPLGLCVNCATPVSSGLFAAGLRSETALATLFASPTLNPIVLTALFTLFPLDMAVTKLALTLAFILVAVPLYTLVFLRGRDDARLREGSALLDQAAFSASWWKSWLFKDPAVELALAAVEPDDSWPGALWLWLKRYLANLLFILRTTLPLMLLAGVLGAILIQLVPLGLFEDMKVSLPALLALAAVGTFLPVPVAFDVIAVSILHRGGLPGSFAMTLLFTLGLFSIYPLMVVWRTMGRGVALAFFGTVVLLGVGAGEYIRLHDVASDQQARAAVEANLEALPSAVSDEIAVAHRHCDPLGPRAGSCLARWVSYRIDNGGEPRICEALKDQPAALEACQRRARSEAAVRASVAAGHTTPCEALEGPERALCRDGAIAIIAEYDLSRSLALCAEHGDPQLVRGCRRTNVLAVMAGDDDMCQYLEDRGDQEECGRLAAITRVVGDRDPAGCATKVAPELSRLCVQKVGDALIGDRVPGDDIKGCDSLPVPAMVTDCRRRFIDLRVKFTADASLCDQLDPGPQLEEMKAACVETAVVRQAAREITKAQVAALAASDQGAAAAASAPAASSPAAAPSLKGRPLPAEAGVEITAFAHAARAASEGPRFTRSEGRDYGITHEVQVRALDVKEPFAVGRGIASGDVDGDGWADLVLAAEHGFELYRNVGGRFQRAEVVIPELASADAFVVALVDVDNDGWLDVFVTSYGGADYVVYNDRKGFAGPRVDRLPTGNALITFGAGWADVDDDGRLDVVLGNWSYGVEKAFIPERSANHLLLNRRQRFESAPLPEVPGETLTTLFTDLDGDGRPELLVGNDYDRPDQYYRQDARGHFQPIARQAGIFPDTPAHTMSLESADLDNDGRLDVFGTDMSFSASESGDYCAPIVDAGDRACCQQAIAYAPLVHNRDVDGCNRLPAAAQRSECVAAVATELAVRSREPGLCERIPARYPTHKAWCAALVTRSSAPPAHPSDHLPQKARNVLLMAGDGGKFKDKAQDLGVAASYWSWNARALDVDNDGWQDIYVGNGYRYAVIHPNVLFHNQGAGKPFVRREREFGLADLFNTPSYTAVDIDNDGDLDLVATAEAAPVRVFRNNDAGHHSVTVALRDDRGNRFGVGARITVRDASGRAQIREIKASGGFMSFDAPVAHFGLGAATSIASIDVRWPGAAGGTTRIKRDLAADTHYVIHRTR